jgi:cytoskeleton protein RodZ
LKTAREALKLSIADVSERLKLDVAKIEALEAGDVENVSTPVFVAGYLRAYARLLNLSAESVLADFSTLPTVAAPGTEPQTVDLAESPLTQNFGPVSPQLSRASSTKPALYIAAVLALLLAVVAYIALQKNENDASLSEKVSTPLKSSIPLSLAPVVPRTDQVAVVDVGFARKTSNYNVSQLTASISESVEVDDVSNKPRAETVSPDDAESLLHSELAFLFNDDSWVEVNDARGERLLYRLAKAGMAQTITGVSPFVVQLGYVPAVEIMYNGAPYDLSRFNGRRSARFNVGQNGDQMSNG